MVQVPFGVGVRWGSVIATTQLGRVFRQHYGSLPVVPDRRGLRRNWPWIGMVIGLPAAGTALLGFADLASVTASAGLLAGIGVLGGLLFEVLASVSGRIATIADALKTSPTPHEIGLITRLDIARANIAYATLVSITFVVTLGVASMLRDEPNWLSLVHGFVLLHLGVTLIVVLLRINAIAEDDRVAALTAHARKESRDLPTTGT